MRKQKNADTIKITEDVRVPGTDVILEMGDKIRVLESYRETVYEIVDGAYGYDDGERVTLLGLQQELDDTGYIVELEDINGVLVERETGTVIARKVRR